MILEDLNPDFKTMKYAQGLTYDQLQESVKSLAYFHALSYAYGQAQNQRFSKLKCQFINYLKDDYESTFELATKDIEKIDPDLAKKVFNLGQNWLEMFQKVLEDPLDDRFLSHGDLWSGNLMFNLNTKVKMIDWQFFCSANPYLDFCVLVYSSAAPDLTESWIDPLIQVYFQQFLKTCLDFKIEIPFTSKEFKMECETKGFLACIAFFMFAYDMICNDPTFFQRLVWMFRKAKEFSPEFFKNQ